MIQFTCDRTDLNNAISVTSRTVAVKSTIPAMEGIMLSAGALLTLTGYNSETGITVSVRADVQEMGAAVFPARLFGDIVRKLPADTVKISIDDSYKVRIRSGQSSFTLMALAADDYPSLPDVEYDKAVTVPQNMLKDMISSTIFAVSENQSRPIQTGCKFEVEPDTMTVVAVDGFRLAMRREKIENPEGRTLSFVVPSSGLREVERLLEDTEENVSFTLGMKQIMFQVGSATLVCRLLEGEFLNWKRVVPTDNPIRLAVNVRELTAALERVMLIVNDKYKSAVRCCFENNKVYLRTANNQGIAEDECQTAGDGQNLVIGFNGRYLLDALKTIQSDNISLELKTNLTPAVIMPTEGDSFSHMILPVRLKAE